MKGVLKDRRAVSPIIAEILLVMIVVGIAFMAYNWLGDFIGDITARADRQIIVQLVGWKDTNKDGFADEAAIYVQNVGKGSVTLSGVFIENSLVNPTWFDADGDKQPDTLGKKATGEGVIATIKVNVEDFKFRVGDYVKIKVICKDGTSTGAYVVAIF